MQNINKMSNTTPDHGDRDHAEFSPASLKYVAGCAGYEGREGTSAAAEKGTRIHEALEVLDPSALHDEEEVGIYEAIVSEESAFLETFTKGADFTEHCEIQLEVELDGTSTWGTCDKFVVMEDTAVLIDYKTGVSVIDEPRDNWQAIAYTVGAFQAHPEVNSIHFVFFIPVRNQTLMGVFTREELPDLIEKLSKVIKQGEKIRPQWEDGQPEMDDLCPTVNCRFCKHEDHCPALGGLAIEVASRVSDSALPKGDISDPEDPIVVEHLFAVAKVVSNWADRIRSKAIKMAKEGVEFPSLKLRSLGATRKCTDNSKLAQLAEEFNMSNEELLALANLPLKKVANAVGDLAPEGEKKKVSNDFLEALEQEGAIKTSETRYTLS